LFPSALDTLLYQQSLADPVDSLKLFPAGTVNGSVTYASILADWLSLRPVQAIYIDSCEGPLCNPTCPLDAATLLTTIADNIRSTESVLAYVFTSCFLVLAVALYVLLCLVGWSDFSATRLAISSEDATTAGANGIDPLLANDQISISFEHIAYSTRSGAQSEQGCRRRRHSTPEAPTDHATGAELLHDVCGVFAAGHMTCVMGTSGCGKTTMMEVVSHRRQDGQERGQVEIYGRCFTDKSDIGYVDSNFTFRDSLTVRETLQYRLCLLDKSPAQRADLFWKVVNETEMNEAVDVTITMCSDGQRRRLSIALALIMDYTVLILDEPTTGMPVGVNILLQILRYCHFTTNCSAFAPGLLPCNNAIDATLTTYNYPHSQGWTAPRRLQSSSCSQPLRWYASQTLTLTLHRWPSSAAHLPLRARRLAEQLLCPSTNPAARFCPCAIILS